MRVRKILVIAGLVGAVAAAAVVGTALAQTPSPTQTPNQAKTNYGNVFLDQLAKALNITRDQLNSAITTARNATVDQAVQDGRLTQDQANQIKSRQGNAPFGFGFNFGFHGREWGHKAGPGMMGFRMSGDVLNAVAGVLKMTPQDLTNQLRSGKTLGQLAQGNEQAVKDAIKNAVKPQLDQAVKNGRMTQQQEDNILNRIQSQDLNQIGGAHWNFGPGKNWNGKRAPKPTPTPSTSPSLGPAPMGAGAL